jgi:1-acyl-sn-glycerol-3-phosphate acyltransferase
VFPEGTWDYSGKLLPAKSGASRIALATGAPIVPLAIVGNHISPWGKSRQLLIGRPFLASSIVIDNSPTASDIAQLTTTIMVRIAQLLPPEYHGYYAPMMAALQSPSKEH